jgi:hypothetical protein
VLLLLGLWIVLGGVWFLVGHGVLVALRLEGDSRAYDRALVTVWLGIALMAPLCLGLYLVRALDPVTGAAVFAGAAGVAASYRENVREMKS